MSQTARSQRGPQADGAATAGFLNTDWSPRELPGGTATRNVVLRTADGAATTGSLYVPGRADTVVCIMHPREFMACHYLVPDIVAAGYAAWSQSPRSVGNDLRLEHEFALYDVAAGVRFLRDWAFAGSSCSETPAGAASTASTSSSQSSHPGEDSGGAGGRPTNLARLDMPEVDGIVLVAPHPGQGALLQHCIDPSVVDSRTRSRSIQYSILSIRRTALPTRLARRRIAPSSCLVIAPRRSSVFGASTGWHDS